MSSIACNVSVQGEELKQGVSYESGSYKNSSQAGDTPSRRTSTSPGNRSRSFSISDILSDDMGSRKRPPISSFESDKVKQAKLNYTMVSPDNTNTIYSPQSAQTLISPINMYSALQQQVRSLTDQHKTLPSQVYPSTVHMSQTPASYPSYQTMANTYVAAQIQHYYQLQAAQLQQQMIAAQQQQQNLLLSNRQHDQLNNINSNQMSNVSRHDNSENSVDENMLTPQYSTPILLKSKRKPTKPCLTPQNTPTNSSPLTMDDSQYHLAYSTKPHYSRSPLQPPNTTFSPSIFLTRPSSSSISHTPTGTSGTNYTDTEREMGSNMFMTSTPIRRGEKISFVSPHSHSPISSGRKEEYTTPEYQLGNDSEVPLLRRPRVPRKRNKSRVMSVSLAENTNSIPPVIVSSRHTPSHPPPPPSSLLLSYTALPTGTAIQHNFSINNDSGFISDTSTNRPTSIVSQQENVPTQYTNKCHLFNSSSENIYKTPVKNVYSNRQQSGNVKYPDAWGSSPFTDHLRKTGQIQSVPPWFVCSDRRSSGKRLRLTEAINKSLMETPSQTTNQLPAEWQKFAYGQTDDQKDLTQKARSFLRCRPRVLHFEKTPSK